MRRYGYTFFLLSAGLILFKDAATLVLGEGPFTASITNAMQQVQFSRGQ